MKSFNIEDPDIRNRVIAKNEFAFALPTNIPIVPGHTLVIPKRAVSKLEELNSDELQAIFSLAKVVKVALAKAFQAEGFNIALNEGKVAGQSVPHLHIHILPRKKDDSGILKYEPREFIYRPGSRPVSPEQELVDIAKLIREKL
jgi:diadenosine tetraphosphate (Ap4A) HIT family hydrolase